MSYYEILGVSEETSASDITKAYRELIKRLHPDTNPTDPAAEELFKEHYKEVVAAYDVLGNASKRKAYDEARGQRQRPEPERQPAPEDSSTREPDDRRAPHRDRTAPQDRLRSETRQPGEPPNRQQPRRTEPVPNEPSDRGAHGDSAPNPSDGYHRRRLRTTLLAWLILLAAWGSVGVAVFVGARFLFYDESPDEVLAWAVDAVTTGNTDGTETSHDGTGWRLGEPHEAEWGIIHARAWVEAVSSDYLLEVRCVTDFERGVDRGLYAVLHPASAIRLALSMATTMPVLSRFSGEQHMSESEWLVGESVLWLDPEGTERFRARFSGADKLFLRIEYGGNSNSEQRLTFDLGDSSALSTVDSACE